MNFLQLVNELRREASVSGSGVTTTFNQTGEAGRLARWIARAYEEIQNKHVDWFFLRKQGTFTTTVGNNVIQPPSDLNVWDIERFFDANGVPVPLYEYANHKERLANGQSGKPDLFLIRNDNRLLADRTPDGAYQYEFDYFRTPHKLTSDTTEPLIPEHLRNVIVARAMIFYGNYESAAEIKQQGTELFQMYMEQLTNQQTPNKQQYYARAQPAEIRVRVE